MDSKIDTNFTPVTSASSSGVSTPVPSNTGAGHQQQTSTAGSQVQVSFDSGMVAQIDAIQQAVATLTASSHLHHANIALLEKLVMALKATTSKAGEETSNSGIQTGGIPTVPSLQECLAIGDLIENGVFNTIEHASASTSHVHKFLAFQRPYPDCPTIMAGLHLLDFAKDVRVRVKAHATVINEHLFQMHVETWGDSIMYHSGCTWLALHPKASELGFQTGTFNTTEDHPAETPKQYTMRWIPFQHPYDAIPAVVLWLNSLETCAGEDQRIHVIASDITKTGFRLYIHSWKETRLYTAGVSWLAYPAEAPGIESGNFLGRWGDVKFTKFSKAPSRVMVAFNKIHSNKKFNLRLTVKCEGITMGGMGWRVDTWADSEAYECGGAYIALE